MTYDRRIKPVDLNPFTDANAPTFYDAIARITADTDLTPARRRDLVSATQAAYRRITKVTARAFGWPLNPHMFRDCAATFIAIEDPEHVRLSAPLLGHTNLSTTEKYYNQAQSVEAGRVYQRSLLALRRETRRSKILPKRK